MTYEELKYRICRECGARCCKRFDYKNWFVTLSLRDIVRISEGLGKDLEYVLNNYIEIIRIGSSIILTLKVINRVCIFLREDRCTIQKFKPIACRVYPVYIPGMYIDPQCPLSKYPELLKDEEMYVYQYVKEHLETQKILEEYSPKSIRDIAWIIRETLKDLDKNIETS